MYPVEMTKGMHATVKGLATATSPPERRRHTDTDESDLPDERKTKNRPSDQSSDTLDNGPEGDTSQTVDLLGVIAQARGKRTGLSEETCQSEHDFGNAGRTYAVLVTIEELDVLPENSLEAHRTQSSRQHRRSLGEEEVLARDDDRGQDGDDKEPENKERCQRGQVVQKRDGSYHRAERSPFLRSAPRSWVAKPSMAIATNPHKQRYTRKHTPNRHTKHNTKRGVNHTSHYSSTVSSTPYPNATQARLTRSKNRSKDIILPPRPIQPRHPLKQERERIIRLRLRPQLPILLLLPNDLARQTRRSVPSSKGQLVPDLARHLRLLVVTGNGRGRSVVGVDGFGFFGFAEFLGGDEVRVVAFDVREELVVGALFEDAAFAHDVDLVGVTDGGETMGDGDGSTT